MATEKLRHPEIAIAYVEGHKQHPDFGFAIAHLVKDLQGKVDAITVNLDATRDATAKLVRDLTARLDTLEARLDALEVNSDKTALYARTDALATYQHQFQERLAAQHVEHHHAQDALAVRLDELEVVVSGNDRTFREVITDNAELATRVAHVEDVLDVAVNDDTPAPPERCWCGAYTDTPMNKHQPGCKHYPPF
ncbi:MAG: hypothetical protein ABIH46_05975 [Chloroflexota bacterium]